MSKSSSRWTCPMPLTSSENGESSDFIASSDSTPQQYVLQSWYKGHDRGLTRASPSTSSHNGQSTQHVRNPTNPNDDSNIHDFDDLALLSDFELSLDPAWVSDFNSNHVMEDSLPNGPWQLNETSGLQNNDNLLLQDLHSQPITDHLFTPAQTVRNSAAEYGPPPPSLNSSVPDHRSHNLFQGRFAIPSLPHSSPPSTTSSQHTCEKCGKACTRADSLRRHRRTIHKEGSKKYVCNVPWCGKEDRRKDKLREHCRNKHQHIFGAEDYREVDA